MHKKTNTAWNIRRTHANDHGHLQKRCFVAYILYETLPIESHFLLVQYQILKCCTVINSHYVWLLPNNVATILPQITGNRTLSQQISCISRRHGAIQMYTSPNLVIWHESLLSLYPPAPSASHTTHNSSNYSPVSKYSMHARHTLQERQPNCSCPQLTHKYVACVRVCICFVQNMHTPKPHTVLSMMRFSIRLRRLDVY